MMESDGRVTFYGPDSESQIKKTDFNDFEVVYKVLGTCKDFSIYLVDTKLPLVLIATAMTSPLSGSTELLAHGYKLELKEKVEIKLETPQGKKREEEVEIHSETPQAQTLDGKVEIILETPQGRMRWKQDSMSSGGEIKLVDVKRGVIAKGTIKDEVKLEIMMLGDEAIFPKDCLELFQHCILAAWVAFIYRMFRVRELEKEVREIEEEVRELENEVQKGRVSLAGGGSS